MSGARLESVCKFICEEGKWKVSNLQLQKILYMSQMIYMGENNGELLVDACFEAWDYGPVEPDLYKMVKKFGSSYIKDVFVNARKFAEVDSRRVLLKEISSKMLEMRPGQLVDLTHWSEGAWAKHYVPGARRIKIPNSDIYAEYKARARA